MRYIYDPVTREMVPGCSPRRVDGPIVSDRLYSDDPFVAPDGTLIDSKKSHREYMTRAGVTTMDDFKDHWEQKRIEREAFYTPGASHDSKSRREDLERAIVQLGGDI